jgi:large subunit ribosomal protein L30
VANIRVTLTKSLIGVKPKQRMTAKALGLGKINSSNVHQDNPAIRGMVKKVAHLVTVTEI